MLQCEILRNNTNEWNIGLPGTRRAPGESGSGAIANESHNAGMSHNRVPGAHNNAGVAGEILETHYRLLANVDTLFICLSFIYGFVVCGRLNFMLYLW